MTATQTAPEVAKSTAPVACKCGCNKPANKGALYLPGHDARHVSMLVIRLRQDAEDGIINTNSKEFINAFGSLPSEALQAKFERAAANSNAKQEKRNQVREAREANKRAAEQKKQAAAEAKAAAKAEADSKVSVVENFKEGDTVKVGRWEYPTRVYKDGSVERNTKTDGSGDWIEHTA